MIHELYIYAKPKQFETKRTGYLPGIFAMVLFSAFIAIAGDLKLSLIVISIYMALTFLCFLDRDCTSRYMKVVMLILVDMSFVSIYSCEQLFPERGLIHWSIIFGIAFSVIYETVVFIKIKNRNYSNPDKNSKTILPTMSLSAILLPVLFVRILKVTPYADVSLLVVFTLLCAMVVLLAVISIQKLIIYLLVRNKIQKNFEIGNE